MIETLDMKILFSMEKIHFSYLCTTQGQMSIDSKAILYNGETLSIALSRTSRLGSSMHDE
jgi:hypothetical protein